MKKSTFAAVLALSSLVALGEEYPISSWTFMRAEQQRAPEVVVKEWKDLGFTWAMSPILRESSKEHARIRRMLDLCQENGLKLLVHDERVHWNCAGSVLKDGATYRKNLALAKEEWASHPACAGFVLLDEPDADQIKVCCKAAQLMHEAMPEKMCFLNLLPWYGWIAKRLGSDAYAPYLDRVAKEAGLDTLCYDCYDQMDQDNGETAGTDIYFNNLREYRAFVQRNPGKRFWVTLMCLSQACRAVKTRTDYQWQISTAAAMGAKGIIWYYIDQNDHESMGNNNECPINLFGERTEHFSWLSFENRRFGRHYGAEFMRLEPDGAFIAGTDKARGGIEPFKGDADVLSVSADKEQTLVSFFHDAQGGRYLATVNLSRKRSSYVRIALAEGVKLRQLTFHHEYKPVPTENDPVLAKRFGCKAVNVVGDFRAPGQLGLYKLR